jgi:hypothetical protein
MRIVAVITDQAVITRPRPPTRCVVDASTPHPDIGAGPKETPFHEAYGSLVKP